MSFKIFILGLCVLVTIVQISSAQDQSENPNEPEQETQEENEENKEQEEDEIETRRKLKLYMNNAVNIIEPEQKQVQDVYTEYKKRPQMNVVAEPPPPNDSGDIGGKPPGGLLKTLFGAMKNLFPLLKPLLEILGHAFPIISSLVKPLMTLITTGFPMLSSLFKMLGPLIKLPAKLFKVFKIIKDCFQTLLKIALKGLKYLLDFLPALLEFLPNLLENLWKAWRNIRYVFLYPIRALKRFLQRIIRALRGIPRYLSGLLRALMHFLVTPVRIIGYLYKRSIRLFTDYVIVPVAKLKYFLINLFDVVLGPLKIIRHFLDDIVCLLIKRPARIIRSIIKAIFVNGLLNTIRYIKTIIYEIIRVPWSNHYADMFPSLGNRHNYLLPAQSIACLGPKC